MDGELMFHNYVAQPQAAKKASGMLAQMRRSEGPCHVTMKSLYSTKELFVPYLNTLMSYGIQLPR